MQGPSWISLLEQIPTKLHNTLTLNLVTGAEIMMQSLLRLGTDFAILRGRMAGTTDAGRVIIVPYDQIVNLAFTKLMLAPEVQAIFGDTLESAASQAEEATAPEEAVQTNDEGGVESPETPHQGVVTPMRTVINQPTPVAPSLPGKNQPQAPSKSILLARLRARLAEQGK